MKGRRTNEAKSIECCITLSEKKTLPVRRKCLWGKSLDSPDFPNSWSEFAKCHTTKNRNKNEKKIKTFSCCSPLVLPAPRCSFRHLWSPVSQLDECCFSRTQDDAQTKCLLDRMWPAKWGKGTLPLDVAGWCQKCLYWLGFGSKLGILRGVRRFGVWPWKAEDRKLLLKQTEPLKANKDENPINRQLIFGAKLKKNCYTEKIFVGNQWVTNYFCVSTFIDLSPISNQHTKNHYFIFDNHLCHYYIKYLVTPKVILKVSYISIVPDLNSITSI